MRVQNNYNHVLSPPGQGVRRTQSEASDFSTALTAALQQDTQPPKQSVLSAHWTDEKLALLAGVGSGVTVDTTKTINWQSTGDHVLTREEIAKLKNKYNVQKLDPQSYYDLISDLSHLNVVSAKDIASMHLRKANLGPNNFLMTFNASGGAFSYLPFSSGNILETLRDELENLAIQKSWSMTSEFLETNPSLAAAGALDIYTGSLQQQTACFEKLQKIFTSLKP